MDEELKKLRKEIDAIDRGILALVEKRVEIAGSIGAFKKKRGLPVSDSLREKEVLDNAAKATTLDRSFVKGLFSSIIDYCKHEEQK
jgi:chorismate mutase